MQITPSHTSPSSHGDDRVRSDIEQIEDCCFHILNADCMQQIGFVVWKISIICTQFFATLCCFDFDQHLQSVSIPTYFSSEIQDDCYDFLDKYLSL
ncbi:MAG: hypothetical protein HY860_06885 [Chlamydiales bacterium]|nr:hypothetical protein [Chlamydiales bacterium]